MTRTRAVRREPAGMSVVFVSPHPVGDDDLLELTRRNPGWKIERSESGELEMTPTSTPGGARSLEAAAQLRDYAKTAGGKAYDSSTGFKTPRGGVVSPDGAWVAGERIASVAASDRLETYWTIAPDVAIEVRSQTDSWRRLRAKIDRYVADGTTYAIAIDPESRDVYESGSPPANLTLDIDAICDA